MACSTEDLTALSSILSSNINTYQERLSAINAQSPTINPAPPLFLKDKVSLQAKDEIVKACERIIALVQAPFESMMIMALAWHETSALKIALDMKLPEYIPLSGDISLDGLAEKVGKGSKDLISRVLRALANRNCFIETSPLHYAHTGISATLTVLALSSLINHTIDEAYKSGPHLSDIARENNFTIPDDTSKTAFSRCFNTDKSFFDYIYSDPDTSRAERFGLAMRGATAVTGSITQDIYTPLKTLPAGSIVCDVGGGLGQASIAMIQECPGPKFIVQDHEIVAAQGREEYPKELSHKIEFQGNDFFKGQPVKGADIYYLRHILHDHPDSNCIRILSHIVAAMDPKKSRILVDDLVLPEQIGPDQNRLAHLRDFQMMVLCNSPERTASQWAALLKRVDERLVIEKIWGSADGPPILECKLQV